MIYLDNAATALSRPRQVTEAMQNALRAFGNPSRGAHGPAMEAARCIYAAREALAKLYGVRDPARVAFFPSATTALNTLIYGMPGHIVTTAAEHNSVLRPMHRRGDYTVVPLDAQGRLDVVVKLAAAIQPDTTAVFLTHASNVTGNVFDVQEVAAFCHRRGLRLIVDAAQTAGLVPISVDDWGVDAVVFSGHKALFGPQGTGGVCLGKDFLLDPMVVGGSGSESFSMDFPEAPPERYEAGTLNAHGIAGLLAGVEYVRGEGDNAYKKADTLSRRFIKKVSRIGDIQIYGDLQAATRIPVVSLNLANMDCAALADSLWARFEIAIRAGIHCAPLMHKALGTEATGTARFSFSCLNTAEEIDEAAEALAILAGPRRRRRT